jgi:hypothetical protein
MSASGPSTSAPAVNEVSHGNPFSWRFTAPLFFGSALMTIADRTLPARASH